MQADISCSERIVIMFIKNENFTQEIHQNF